MTHSNDITNMAGMPVDVQQRMLDIIRKHADGYRKDLPGLIASLRLRAEDLAKGRDMDEARDALEREAHDMKGQAATFGLPDIASVAKSLCRIVEGKHALDAGCIDMIQTHVETLERLVESECKNS